MEKHKGYPMVDYFRMIAAVLVVAIHISPLEEYSRFTDFLLTRVAARIAVPFFLMTTGFFLFPHLQAERARTEKFLKKTGILYGAAILLYLPLNLYNGYFSGKDFFKKCIQDILFDGTMYHLWYFPAVVLGVGIVTVLLRKVGEKSTIVVCVLLYIIGLFGDSYFGVVERITVLKAFYQALFGLFDYTRNGIFFAPIFLVMGALLSKWQFRSEKIVWAGVVLSFVGMAGEGTILYLNHLQRHDSMYFFLIPAMMFLFAILIEQRGKRRKLYGTISMIVYIIHPWMIVMTRMCGKILHIEKILTGNQLIQFGVVTLSSFIAAAIVCTVAQKIGGRQRLKMRSRGYPLP